MAAELPGAPRRSRRRRVIAVTAVVILAAVLVTATLGQGDDVATERPRPAPGVLAVDPTVLTGGEARPMRGPAVEPAGGSWRWLEGAGIPVPSEHRGTWTGSELVVVGTDDLALYDPARQRWRLLRGPVGVGGLPDQVRVVAWTGRELLLLGVDLGAPAGRARGFAVDLDRGRWRTIVSPPDTGSVAIPAAAWTGRELVVWGLERTVAYDPLAQRWHELEAPPVPPRIDGQMVATDRHLVVWGEAVEPLRHPFAAVYDLARREWRRVDDPPLYGLADAPGAWTGEELLLVSPRSADPPVAGSRPAIGGLRLDPDLGRWAPMSAPPWLPATTSALSRRLSASWTGDRLVVVGGMLRSFGGVYDPATGTWQRLPVGAGGRARPVLAWTGDRLLVWGADGGAVPLGDLVSWQPRPADEP